MSSSALMRQPHRWAEQSGRGRTIGGAHLEVEIGQHRPAVVVFVRAARGVVVGCLRGLGDL